MGSTKGRGEQYKVYRCKEHPHGTEYYDLKGIIESHFKPHHLEIDIERFNRILDEQEQNKEQKQKKKPKPKKYAYLSEELSTCNKCKKQGYRYDGKHDKDGWYDVGYFHPDENRECYVGSRYSQSVT